EIFRKNKKHTIITKNDSRRIFLFSRNRL
ncbi:hypothetical protein, partial [uncultured Gammaproteobacteria bacterium]